VIDFEKKITLQELNSRYIGLEITLYEKKFRVHKISEEKNAFTVMG